MINVLIPGTTETSVMMLVRDIKSLEHRIHDPVSEYCVCMPGIHAGSAAQCNTTGTDAGGVVVILPVRSRVRSCIENQNNNTVIETECRGGIAFNINRVKQPLTLKKEAAMNIVVTGRHFTISEEIRELTETKVENALKVFPRVVRHTRIIISHENLEYEIEANVELTTKKKIITSIAKDKDLRVALDLLNAKLNEQIRRLKERIADKHRTIKTAQFNTAE